MGLVKYGMLRVGNAYKVWRDIMMKFLVVLSIIKEILLSRRVKIILVKFGKRRKNKNMILFILNIFLKYIYYISLFYIY